jgi:type IV pilus assembly protein PilE
MLESIDRTTAISNNLYKFKGYANMYCFRGFSLVELLITIGILTILIGIGYPIYANYVSNTHRVQAEQTLLMISQDMEVYHSEHQSYLGASLKNIAPYALKKNNYYQFSIAELTDGSYELVATSKKHDKKCGDLSIDQLGEKSHTGNGSADDCWQ